MCGRLRTTVCMIPVGWGCVSCAVTARELEPVPSSGSAEDSFVFGRMQMIALA